MSFNDTREDVLVIRMLDGAIVSLVSERREVYKNTKGRYIKTRGDGNIPVDEWGRAVISYRYKDVPRAGSPRPFRLLRKVQEDEGTITDALWAMALQYNINHD